MCHFFWNLFNSDIALFSRIIRYSMHNIICENVRYSMYKYKIVYNDWFNDLSNIFNCIKQKQNKTGDTSDKNNYRPIAIVTAASKLFEICILKVLDAYLITHDHQFGFKSKHSTDMCIFTVESVIKCYTEQNTAVYTCLLDARKAFDRVNHWTLFAKLIDTQAPLLIVCVLLFWYQMQNVCINGDTLIHITLL